jgi:hypothetical protein
MVDGLHVLIRNKTMKLLAIALSGVWRKLRGRDSKGDLPNVQYKPIWNCHNESPLLNEYILSKKGGSKDVLGSRLVKVHTCLIERIASHHAWLSSYSHPLGCQPLLSLISLIFIYLWGFHSPSWPRLHL